MVTSLPRPFGDLRRRKRGLGDRGLLRGGWCRGGRRRECSWNFIDVWRVIDVLSLPPFRSGKDSCQVKRLYPHFLAVVPIGFCQPLR